MRQSDCRNRLLSIMSAGDFGLLAKYLEPTELPLATVLSEAHQPIRFMYFLEEGVASLIASTPQGVEAEAGLVGREGFTIPAVALNVDQMPHGSRMQVPGHGFRIKRRKFVESAQHSSTLLDLLLRFAQCLIIQTSYTAMSNAIHEIDVRLARWLLMIHDRSPGHDLPLTHEYVSIMLGVQRTSVTNALHVLEGYRFILSKRGHIFIRDRTGLENFASEAYGIPENEYRRLIGSIN